METYVPGTPRACLTGSVSPASSILGVGTCPSECVWLCSSHTPTLPCDRRLHPSVVPGFLLRLCESCLLGKCLSLLPTFDSAAGTKVAVDVSEEDHLFMPKTPFLNHPFPSPPLPSSPFPSFLSVTSFPVGSLCHSISLWHSLTPFRLRFTKYTTYLFSPFLPFFLCVGLVLFAGSQCFPLVSSTFLSCRSLCHFLLENRKSTRMYFPNSQSSSKCLQGTYCALGTVLDAGRQSEQDRVPALPGSH